MKVLKSEKFSNEEKVCEFVNKKRIMASMITSITAVQQVYHSNSGTETEYTLFYWENDGNHDL